MQTSVTALHRATTWAMTGLSLLLACACATPTAPESRYTVDLPAGWSVAAADAAANQATALDAGPWWARFGDTTLSTLAVQAAQHNTRIQTAEAALRQARALRDVSAAALSPTLGLSAQAQRGKG